MKSLVVLVILSALCNSNFAHAFYYKLSTKADHVLKIPRGVVKPDKVWMEQCTEESHVIADEKMYQKLVTLCGSKFVEYTPRATHSKPRGGFRWRKVWCSTTISAIGKCLEKDESDENEEHFEDLLENY